MVPSVDCWVRSDVMQRPWVCVFAAVRCLFASLRSVIGCGVQIFVPITVPPEHCATVPPEHCAAVSLCHCVAFYRCVKAPVSSWACYSLWLLPLQVWAGGGAGHRWCGCLSHRPRTHFPAPLRPRGAPRGVWGQWRTGTAHHPPWHDGTIHPGSVPSELD